MRRFHAFQSTASTVCKDGRFRLASAGNGHCLKVIKIAAGAGLAIGLASFVGLKYSASAGIITLLSIQNTRKETIQIVCLRLVSFVVSLILAAGSFCVFGYTPLAVGCFLLFYASFCMRFQMEAGLSVNAVLMTHFLAEKTMAFPWIWNETMLLLIGGGLGILLNLYMPEKKTQIKAMQLQIEGQMKEILGGMSRFLSGKSAECRLSSTISDLAATLAAGEKDAYEEMQNHLLSETRYYLRYMNMRRVQTDVLKRMEKQLNNLRNLPYQAVQVAELLDRIQDSFHEHNNAIELLRQLETCMQDMRKQPLPESREEFESRAILYQFLLETEEFLMIKKSFVLSLGQEEIRKFWGVEI